MEVRFEFEGDTRRVGGLPRSYLSRIKPPEDLEGVDFTDCSVALVRSGGEAEVERAKANNPDKVVIWRYPTNRGQMVGIYFPPGFDPSSVSFYRTDKQVRDKRMRAIKAQARA